LCTAGFVVALTGDQNYIVKPDRQLQSIGLADPGFAICEQIEAVLDVVERVIVSMWFLITSEQAMVDSLTVIGGCFTKVPLPQRLEVIDSGDVLDTV
jgi:hypothetical protein